MKVTRLLSIVLTVSAISATLASRMDTGHLPIILLPDDSTLSNGQTVTFTVTLDGTTTTNQSVSLSSSNSALLPVPPSTTIPAGQSTATFQAQVASPIPKKYQGLMSSPVVVTASANGGSTSTTITVQ